MVEGPRDRAYLAAHAVTRLSNPFAVFNAPLRGLRDAPSVAERIAQAAADQPGIAYVTVA